jgi:ribonuclease BN (tRNA processing enzyme)
MRVIIIGSGASWPDAERSSPSQLIEVGGKEPLLFDCGPGTGMNLMKAGISPATVNWVFLTHLHMDHCVEFPSILFAGYLAGRKQEVRVFGPTGTNYFYKSMFDQIYPYAPEVVERIREEGWNVAVNEITMGPVCQPDGCRVLSTQVEHGTPGVAYRIEAEEGSVVISGDTRPSKSLIELAKGADLLIHECSFPDDMAELAKQTNHSAAFEVGEVANQAGVKKVVLTHLFPLWKGREKEMIKSVKSKFRGEVIPSHDLLEIKL